MRNWLNKLNLNGWLNAGGLKVTVFDNLTRALRLVWDTSPNFTLKLAGSTILQGLIPATLAWIIKLVVDEVVQGANGPVPNLTKLLPLVGIGLAVGLIGAIANSFGEFAQQQLRDLLGNRLNLQLMNKAAGLELAYFEDPKFYDQLQRARNETGFRPIQVIQQLIALARQVTTIITLAFLILWFNWILVILLFLFAPLALYLQAKYGRKSFDMSNWQVPQMRQMMYYQLLLTYDQPAKEIKLFGLAPFLITRYQALFTKLFNENRTLALRRSLTNGGLEILSNTVYWGTYLWIISQAVTRQISVGDLTLYTAIFMQLQLALSGVLASLSGLYEANLYLSNLFGFLDLPQAPTIYHRVKAVPTSIQTGFELHNVSFSYPGSSANVLENVNLSIKPGEKLAVVGENGAGKTTLVKLLTRLYDPTAGNITLDGVDLQDYDLTSLRERISVVFQDFMCYYLPARENIGLGQIEGLNNDALIIAAAQKSGAHPILAGLPNGYNTLLGRWFEDGYQLSVGEWQKVALARAFMRENAFLLVLDEPTASLDAPTEYEIFQKFATLVANRSALLISHRFSTVRMADRIVVLQRGRIIEEGTHETLMALDGTYTQFFNMQAQGYRT